jgi:tetratricopeptide (TPR) repeat protein
MPMSDEPTRAADEAAPEDRGVMPDCPPGYELRDELGQGGMGVVYRARDCALDREVALKFLRRGYAVGSTTALRFLEEARITGRLQHPGIPPVHQVGTLPDGRPFLAMKLIRGDTLADRLAHSGPHPTRWLGVFEAVSQAVGYAHAQGVVHRDLKPANIMVGDHGEVQVMDWGLAKELGAASEPIARPTNPAETIDHQPESRPPRESDGSITQAGSVLGTPQYMPPEQAAGEIEKISERTDVFGLGAVLCVLLTGQPPFEGTTAETTRLNAVRGRTEAAFARLDACGAEADVVALCKRCLAFEPGDRPATGAAVAEAVAAIRQQAEERAKRAEVERATAAVQVLEGNRRRRILLVAGGLAAGILGLGVVGTTIGLVRAVQARRDEAEQRRLADAARAKAQARLESAIALVDRLTVRVNGTQWATNPDLQDERRQILEDAVVLIAELAGDDSTDPLVRREIARANHRVGEMYMLLGRQPEADKAIGQAIQLFDGLLAENPEGVDYLVGAAEARIVAGSLASMTTRFDESARAFDSAREYAEKAAKLEPSNLEHQRRILQSRTYRSYLLLLENRGGGPEVVQPVLDFARQLGGSPDAPFGARFELGFALNMAGTFAMNAGQFPLAAKHFREAGEILRELGARTAPTAREAERLLQTRAMVGIQLGLVEAIQARSPDEARRIAGEIRQSLAILDGLLAIQPRTATYQIQKIQGLSVLAQLDRSFAPREQYRATVRALRGVEDALTKDRPAFEWVRKIGVSVFGVAMVEDARAGRPEAVPEAEHLLRVVGMPAVIPSGSPQMSTVKYNAACVFALASAKDDDANRRVAFADRAMKLLEELKAERYFRNPVYARTLGTDPDLAPLYDRADWRRFVATVAKEYLAAVRPGLPPDSADLANQLANVGKILVDVEDYPSADPVLRECLRIREALAPAAWTTFNAKSMLGAALAGLSKPAEAEPYLKAGYDGLVRTSPAIPPNAPRVLFDAGFRLAALYRATNRPAEAAALTAALPREPAPAPREAP